MADRAQVPVKTSVKDSETAIPRSLLFFKISHLQFFPILSVKR